MLRINLLPWRLQQQRYEKKLIRWWVIAIAALCVVIMLSAHFFLSYKVQDLQVRLQNLRQRFSSMKLKPIQSDNFFSWRKVLHKVDENNQTLLHALTALHANTSICLLRTFYADNQFSFAGRTASVSDALNYLQQLTIASLVLDSLQTKQSAIFFRAHFPI